MQLNTSHAFYSLGLTSNQIAVYKDLLKNGAALASVAARRIKLDKSSTYRACEALVTRGLVVVEPKRRGSIYTALDPEILQTLLDEQVKKLQNQKSDITEIIETLKKDAHDATRKTYITIEKGIEAYYKMQEHALTCKEKYIREKFAFSSKRFMGKKHEEYILAYIKRRASSGIHIAQLYDQESAKHGDKSMIPSVKDRKEIRVLPDDVEDKNFFRVYDDRVIIISSDEMGEFIVVTIEDRYVASMMKSLFDFIWARSEPYISPLSGATKV